MKRYASHMVSKEAHKDMEIRENINTLTPGMLTYLLHNKFGHVPRKIMKFVQRFDKGEVTRDSRGQGTLQQVE